MTDRATQQSNEECESDVEQSDDTTPNRTDPRPLTPDTPSEWMELAAREERPIMLEASGQTVFVARVQTDEFADGYKWIANCIDPESGARKNSFATHESLIERWFGEAVSRGRAWGMEWDETPLERDSA